MLESIRRFFAPRDHDAGFDEIAAWAHRRGHLFRRARRGLGFVVEGLLEGRPWRIEWGPSQRPYIDGQELRARMELQLPSDQQMLLLSAPLMDTLERLAFAQYTDPLRTETDTEVPEEVRWLVMLPKVDLSDIKGLGSRFGVVSSQPAVGRAWIDGPLASCLLQEAESGLLRADPALMLITLRGRTYLRLQLARPTPEALASVLDLFETAITQAIAAAAIVTDTSADFTAGAASTWESLQPDEQQDPRKRR